LALNPVMTVWSGIEKTWRHLAGVLGLVLLGLADAGADPAPQAAPVILAVSFGLVGAMPENGALPANLSPLFAASDAVGLPERLAIQISDLFAEEVDFHRDLLQGYACTLVYEMYYPNGMPEAGRILAARFVTPDKRLEAFLFTADAGAPTYFDDAGLDVNKTLRLVDPEQEPWLKTLSGAGLAAAFRRSPLEFSRITSLPAALRYHPILKEWRAHRGTDYGAPIGAKVRATADGVVTHVGTRNSYGKLVEMRHFDRYVTRYGHLSAYAPGLAVGTLVSKGQVIGEVGMTGLATGPHLHYELHAEPGATPADRLAFAIRSITPVQRGPYQAVMAEQRRLFDFAERHNRFLLSWPTTTAGDAAPGKPTRASGS
jgi:murein DD-endopeptidase MepM/ murein hydrolase activator NlpD